MQKRGRPKRDYTGEQVGDLVVLEYLGASKWRCKCKCGAEVIRPSKHLKLFGYTCRHKRVKPTQDHIMELRNQGKTWLEIGNMFDYSWSHVRNIGLGIITPVRSNRQPRSRRRLCGECAEWGNYDIEIKQIGLLRLKYCQCDVVNEKRERCDWACDRRV
jgi:hypothetical protein